MGEASYVVQNFGNCRNKCNLSALHSSRRNFITECTNDMKIWEKQKERIRFSLKHTSIELDTDFDDIVELLQVEHDKGIVVGPEVNVCTLVIVHCIWHGGARNNAAWVRRFLRKIQKRFWNEIDDDFALAFIETKAIVMKRIEIVREQASCYGARALLRASWRNNSAITLTSTFKSLCTVNTNST